MSVLCIENKSKCVNKALAFLQHYVVSVSHWVIKNYTHT